MIPVRYPSSLLRRVSEPYVATLGPRLRQHRSGNVTRSARRQRVVRVRCACGSERAIELRAWLRRPPSRCLACHHEKLRVRAAWKGAA